MQHPISSGCNKATTLLDHQEMLYCGVACPWCHCAVKFAILLIPPLALGFTGSFILLNDLKIIVPLDHAHFPSALHQRICQCTVQLGSSWRFLNHK